MNSDLDSAELTALMHWYGITIRKLQPHMTEREWAKVASVYYSLCKRFDFVLVNDPRYVADDEWPERMDDRWRSLE